MIPRQPPIVNEPADDPTEFERPLDFNAPNVGPRVFAERTRGSWSIGGRADVQTPENTRSGAP